MRPVYAVSDNIFSPLGKTTVENIISLRDSKTGILSQVSDFSPEPFFASLLTPGDKNAGENLSIFEQMVARSAMDAIQRSTIPVNNKTGFILSTTKGNISLIEDHAHSYADEELSLYASATRIASALGIHTQPVVASHACISGLLAIITAMRLIQSGKYNTIIVSGGDLITSFIYSGFRSFQAISPNPCKPFDAARDGISLGEAAATLIVSAEKIPGAIRLTGGSVSNDANHISGPSRTGEELFLAIRRAMSQAEVEATDIDFISAHGTATRYNDDMEAKAIHLAGMQEKPVNSLKGNYGHTLGAAGILESIVTIQSMKEGWLLPTLGYSTPGTEKPVNVVKEFQKATLQTCLKTASGFGGCNAALIMTQS